MITPPYTALDIRFDIAAAEPGVNPYSARGLQGTLAPIAMARGDDKLARTVNGTLVSLAAPQMRKYRLEVSCTDQAPPATDGLWVGMLVSVDCMVELAHRTGSAASRTGVPGSARVEGDYTYYQPRLSMLVVEYEVQRSEWAAEVSWSMALEEV
jgi:hypothetical protein